MAARTVPTLRTFIAGEVAVGAYLNANVRDLGNFLLGVPLVGLRQTVGQNLLTATDTSLLWDSEDFDGDGTHSTTSATDTVTVAVAGTVLLVAKVFMNAPAAAAGNTELWWTKNAVDIPATSDRAPNLSTSVGAVLYSVMPVSVAVGDALKVFARQTSGGTVATVTGGASTRFQSMAAMYWWSR